LKEKKPDKQNEGADNKHAQKHSVPHFVRFSQNSFFAKIQSIILFSDEKSEEE